MTRDEFLTAYARTSAFSPGELRALGNHAYERAEGGWELCGRGTWRDPERLALVLGDDRYRLSPLCPNDPDGHARMTLAAEEEDPAQLHWLCPYCYAEEVTDAR